MAKAMSQEIVTRTTTVTLELSEDEAQRLMALLGSFGDESPVSMLAGPNLFHVLKRVVPENGQHHKYGEQARDAIKTRAAILTRHF